MAVRVVYIQKPSVRVCYDVCVWENVCVNERERKRERKRSMDFISP